MHVHGAILAVGKGAKQSMDGPCENFLGGTYNLHSGWKEIECNGEMEALIVESVAEVSSALSSLQFLSTLKERMKLNTK